MKPFIGRLMTRPQVDSQELASGIAEGLLFQTAYGRFSSWNRRDTLM